MQAIEGSNVVINLLGRESDTRNFTLQEVNVNTADMIAQVLSRLQKAEGVHTCLLVKFIS